MRQVVLAGHEIELAPARRSKHSARPVVFPMSAAERRFMLYRLQDRGAMADAIRLFHPESTEAITWRWSREQVLERLDSMIDTLLRGRDLILISRLERLLAIEAIEGNPYFAQMRASDPRLTVAAVKAADHLRSRLAVALDKRIRRVNLGAGRKRLVEQEVEQNV